LAKSNWQWLQELALSDIFLLQLGQFMTAIN
jgi:hypothetical protein